MEWRFDLGRHIFCQAGPSKHHREHEDFLQQLIRQWLWHVWVVMGRGNPGVSSS